MSEFDSDWKEAIEAFFEPFMALFLPQAHREIDWGRDPVMLDKELQQITREYSAEQVRQLYQVIDSMMTLPKPLAELAWQEIYDFEKEKNMPYISTAERVGLEKGLAPGLAKGPEEGLLAGIEVALRMWFGEADTAMMSDIRQLGDASLLRTILNAVPLADTPQSLRSIWFKS